MNFDDTDMPSPDDLEGMRDFFQDVLGDDYEISIPQVLMDNSTETMLGMVVKHVNGDMLTGNQVVALFAERGVEVHFGGPEEEIPDTVPDELTGAVDPSTLTETYGPKAAEMVDQIGRLINLSWYEQYQILANVVGHLKMMGLDEEQCVHLFSVMGYLPIAEGRNRQYLGALLEGYRRDNNLDADDLQTLVKVAAQRVRDLVYGNAANEEAAIQVTTMLRAVYLGEEEFKDSWPPSSEDTIRTLFNSIEAAHEDDD